MSGVDAAVLRAAIALEYACLVWSGFGKVACTIGGVMRGVGLLEDALVTMRLLDNNYSPLIDVVDLRSW